MIENCTVYLPNVEVNFQAVFPGGTSDAAPSNKPTRYEYETPQGPIQLNLKYAAADSNHLAGLADYIRQLENSPNEIEQAIEMVNQVEMFFGVVLPEPVSVESEAFQSLMFLTEQQQGFMFVADSILTADGYVVGPMTYVAEPIEAENLATTNEQLSNGDIQHQTLPSVPPHVIDRRETNLSELAAHGFVCAESLPYPHLNTPDLLRPAEEIASRLFAQMALFMWVAAPEEKATSDGIGKFIVNNNLDGVYTEAEWQILQMDRDTANAEHGAQIGWHLENMWALAWVCGFEPAPTFHDGQISSDVTRAVLEHLPNLGGTVDSFLATSPLRSNADVSTKEDLFYCAHNAVRSAQLGSETVPDDFDPVTDGGAIHERRHALTWCLSPGVSWADTDLST